MRVYRTDVLRYAMRVCVSHDDAEDAIQETFLWLASTTWVPSRLPLSLRTANVVLVACTSNPMTLFIGALRVPSRVSGSQNGRDRWYARQDVGAASPAGT
ncbi:sigma factor [Sorangium sp. So ce367]|uniref:sigma factor n=1 Tax=Sorangium sp. So ce367 TaxID=3133305 RepID=UPI003F6295BA